MSNTSSAIPQYLEDAITKQLEKAYAIGFSYGTKTCATVIKDKLSKHDDLQTLVDDINQFVDITLALTPADIAANYEKLQNKIKQVTGKNVNEKDDKNGN